MGDDDAVERLHPNHVDGQQCQAGWNRLIARVFALARERGVRIEHVTEQFGALRIAHYPFDQAVFEATERGEEESKTICELCGAPGSWLGTGWCRTRCAAHADMHYVQYIEHHRGITRDLDVLKGAPCIRGTRITIDVIHASVEAGHSLFEIRCHWPMVTQEHLDEIARFYTRSAPLPDASRAWMLGVAEGLHGLHEAAKSGETDQVDRAVDDFLRAYRSNEQ